MADWQPIETAPKDGTIIDVWHDRWGRHTDVKWGEYRKYQTEGHLYEPVIETWLQMNDDYGEWMPICLGGGITHWAPVPMEPTNG